MQRYRALQRHAFSLALATFFIGAAAGLTLGGPLGYWSASLQRDREINAYKERYNNLVRLLDTIEVQPAKPE